MDPTPPAERPIPEPNPYEPPQAPTGSPTPTPTRSGPRSALVTVFGGASVLLSGIIAFVATCVPVGFLTFSQALSGTSSGLLTVLPWLVGIACAIGTGALVFRLIFRRQSVPPSPPGEAKSR